MTFPRKTSVLLTCLLLGACASTSAPPPELVEARSALGSAERDPAVQSKAPLELRKASDSLARADGLLAKSEPLAEVSSAAYIATQQARTAVAVAQAKSNEELIASAELERERARADGRTQDALRARAQATDAQAQASAARDQASAARDQASAARAQANSAQVQASASRDEAASAEQRARGAQQQAAASQADASEAQRQAAQLQQSLNDLQAKQTDRGMLVTLGDVLFEFNRADVKPAAQSSLRKLADFLQRYPDRRILIEGHTDNIGSSAYNDTLSRRRADAVDLALVGMGLSAQRVTSVGYGKEFPIADNSSDTNRAMNRRVEVYIAEAGQSVRSRR